MERIPAIVMGLAGAVPQLGPRPPQPVAWKETPTEWVIVFEDGRKLRFIKEPETVVEKQAVAVKPTRGALQSSLKEKKK